MKNRRTGKKHLKNMHGPPVYVKCCLCSVVKKNEHQFINHINSGHQINGTNLVKCYGTILLDYDKSPGCDY